MFSSKDASDLKRVVDEYIASREGVIPPPVVSPGTDPAQSMTKTFEHLFNYSGQPDWKVWDSQFWYANPDGTGSSLVDNKELQWYINHRNRVGGIMPWIGSTSGMKLRAEPLPKSLIPSIGYNQEGVHNVGSYRYSSGMLQNKATFSQQYGYFEIECKVPAGKGLWPAFWLLPSSGHWPPEIDVFEILGHETNRLYFTEHWVEADTHQSTHIENWADYTQRQRIGCLWTPDTLTFYMNGKQAADGGVLPNKIHEPMYMLVDLAVGGGWPGNPDSATKFPADFEIYAIRAFK